MERILVIRGGAIGDFVLTLPALKLLRDAYPDSHIEIVGYKHIVALAENRFYAQAVRSIEAGQLARFFAKGAEIPRELSDYFASFDLVLSYLFDPDGIFEGNVRRCGAEKFLTGPAKINEQQHAARQLAQPLGELGLELTDPTAVLYPSAADRNLAVAFRDTLKAPVVALHPGSGSETKNWPIEHWVQLAEWLLRVHHAASLLVIGGEADEEQLDAFHVAKKRSAVRFAENLPLPELAALLQDCACFVGHDSGISHIAAAVGAPCVLLFGPTDPSIWAPLNPNVRVIRAQRGSMPELPQADVRAKIDAILKERAQRCRHPENLKNSSAPLRATMHSEASVVAGGVDPGDRARGLCASLTFSTGFRRPGSPPPATSTT